MKVFHWAGELFLANTAEEVRRIAAETGCMGLTLPREPISEVTGRVNMLPDGRTWKVRSVADVLREFAGCAGGGWLMAGGPHAPA